MRITIRFKGDRRPAANRFCDLSLIKEAMYLGDAEYAEQVFEKEEKEMKPFAFSVFLHNFRLREKDILIDGFTLTVSSSSIECITALLNGFIQMKEFTYRNYSWMKEDVKLGKEQAVQSSSVLFRTLSPILIENEKNQPLFPTDPAYEREFNYFANLITRKTVGRDLNQPLKIEPVQMKKMVVKQQGIHEELSKKLLYFTCFKGLIKISGHPDDLKCLYLNGISKRRSMGFGLLEIERNLMG